MPRLPQVSDKQASATQAELFSAVKSKMGRVPNLVRALANSPAALRGYLGLSGALSEQSALKPVHREIISLAIAEANGCEYCLAAHSTVGKMVGLSPSKIESARRGEGGEGQNQAVAAFAAAVLKSRGRVSDNELTAFRHAGFGDDAIAEVVANVAANVYTNFFNNLAQTDVDFPAAAPLAPSLAPASAPPSGAASEAGHSCAT